jgi:hypothetical protein
MTDPATAGTDQTHAAAQDGNRSRREHERALVANVFRSARQSGSVTPSAAVSPAVSYTELPPPRPESSIAREWEFYRREVANLLTDGQEGRFVLIKGEAVVGIWDTEADAEDAARGQFPTEPALIHQVRRREPLLRLSPRLQQWLS